MFQPIRFSTFLDWKMQKIASQEGMFRLLDTPAEWEGMRQMLAREAKQKRDTPDGRAVQELQAQLNAVDPNIPLVVGGGNFPESYFVSATMLVNVEQDLAEIMRQEGNPFHIDTFIEDYCARQVLKNALQSASTVERLYIVEALGILEGSGQGELELSPLPSSVGSLSGGAQTYLPCDEALGFPAPLWNAWTQARMWWNNETCHPDIIGAVPLLRFSESYATFTIFYNSNHSAHRQESVMKLDQSQWQRVVDAFHREPVRTVQEERRAIKRAVAAFGKIVADLTHVTTPPFADGGAIAKEPVTPTRGGDDSILYEEDCINKSDNIAQLLWHLQQAGLLQFHHTDVTGAIAKSSRFRHFGNRIVQNDTGENFVVDAWVVATGQEPVIAPELPWAHAYREHILTLDNH
ncbi:MAG: hypothetical protein HY465_01560 [Deltaproteobacteria bacterium]|nr:hypothetical protein [Deltaproteobacteria bacterium]